MLILKVLINTKLDISYNQTLIINKELFKIIIMILKYLKNLN